MAICSMDARVNALYKGNGFFVQQSVGKRPVIFLTLQEFNEDDLFWNVDHNYYRSGQS